MQPRDAGQTVFRRTISDQRFRVKVWDEIPAPHNKDGSYSSPSDGQRKEGRRKVAASRRPGLSKILPSILKALSIICNFSQLVKV